MEDLLSYSKYNQWLRVIKSKLDYSQKQALN